MILLLIISIIELNNKLCALRFTNTFEKLYIFIHNMEL